MQLTASLLALLTIATGLSSTMGTPLGLAFRRSIHDEFFNPPADFSAKSHGSILKHRKVDVSGLNITVPVHAAYQLLYKSWDPILHEPFATPATIIVPAGNKAAVEGKSKEKSGKDKKKQLKNKISFHQVAYDSAYKACGPSFQLANDSHVDPTGTDLPLVELLLSQNITVVLPDYEGPRGAFNVGPVEGNGVLDAVRAVLGFSPVVPWREEAAVVLDGYSGGAIATGWALQQQSSYAPELIHNIKGATLGGLPSNATADFLKLDGTIASGLVVSGLTAQSNIFDSFKKYFKRHLNDAGRKALALAESSCLTADEAVYPHVKFFETFTDQTQAQALRDPLLTSALSRLVLAKSNSAVPQVPVFLYSSEVDDIVPHEDSVRYRDSVCSRGVKSLEFLNVLGTNHTETQAAVFPRKAYPYILQRFAGVPATPGCTESTFDASGL
ncbi:LIP-domain-containing protein [Tilletiaria anomala UBC 951]|uniref:triacylglycerol lipase n=1 Tax=Tilletiaria anomala (strain ATCC 24038 / CBS 436.72 / UBC 951) TaxID=1037660 RepID=A0A066W413_TILAU|nr:LIP-domain-containing protein [Tilletiaria anomala UBC 951]KDN48456.1 LIP-domain-containing protein [Tilletiaria anomala UBC 951]